MRPAILCLFFASSVVCAQGFHKCISPEGTVTFTDVACPKHKQEKYQKTNREQVVNGNGVSPLSKAQGNTTVKEKPLTDTKSTSSPPVAKR